MIRSTEFFRRTLLTFYNCISFRQFSKCITECVTIRCKNSFCLGPGGAERIDASKDTLPTSIVPARSSHVQRDEELAVGSKLLVNLKASLGDTTIGCLGSWERFVKERQTFSAEVSHRDTGCWHDRHKGIQGIVRKRTRRVFPSRVSLQVAHIVGGATEQSVGKARSHQHAGEKSERFVTKH